MEIMDLSTLEKAYESTAGLKLTPEDYNGQGANAPLTLLRAAKIFKLTGDYPQELVRQIWFNSLKKLSPAPWLKSAVEPVFSKNLGAFFDAMTKISPLAKGPATAQPSDINAAYLAVGILMQVLPHGVFDLTLIEEQGESDRKLSVRELSPLYLSEFLNEPDNFELLLYIGAVTTGYATVDVFDSRMSALSAGHASFSSSAEFDTEDESLGGNAEKEKEKEEEDEKEFGQVEYAYEEDADADTDTDTDAQDLETSEWKDAKMEPESESENEDGKKEAEAETETENENENENAKEEEEEEGNGWLDPENDPELKASLAKFEATYSAGPATKPAEPEESVFPDLDWDD